MFWQKGKNTIIEPYNKFKFVAEFNSFEKKEVSNQLNIDVGYIPTRFHLAVKKIDLPKMNIDFERSYANEYVHYFQNGPIHWEPINITFIDAATHPNDIATNFDDLRLFFNNYINARSPETNRTNVIDIPSLCENISISSISRFALQTYPTPSTGKIVQANQNPNDNTGSLEQTFVNSNNSLYKKEIFVIKRPRLVKVDFGSMDYSSDDINEINITVIPEWCNYDIKDNS